MLEEVLRYKRFDIDIKIQQDNRKATTQEEVEGRYKAAVQATKGTFAYKISDEKKEEFREAYNLVKAQGKKAMTLDELSKALDEKQVELQNQKNLKGPKR